MKGFFMHEVPLRKNSALFEAAIAKDQKESKERLVKLPEEDPRQFASYAQWVYTRKLVCPKHSESNIFIEIFSLYLMGSRLQDIDFQDACIDAIIAEMDDFYPCEASVDIIYPNTVTGDPTRLLLVETWMLHGSTKGIEEGQADSGTFYYELTKALATLVWDNEKPRPIPDKDGNTCRYHQHEKDECYHKGNTL